MSLNLFADGWTQKKNHGIHALSFTYIRGESVFLAGGSLALGLARPVLDATINHYLEYGINNRLTFISSLPIKFVSTSSVSLAGYHAALPEGKLTGPGNYVSGFRFKLYEKKWIISLQGLIALPTRFSRNESGLQTGYDAWAFTPSIQLARGFKNMYASLDFGCSLRTNNYSNDIVASFETGYTVKKKLLIAGQLIIRQSLRNQTRDDGNFLRTALYVNDQEYISPVIKLGYYFSENLSIHFASGFALQGNYVATFPALSLSIVKSF